jgi:hypothetical protein
LVFVSYSHLDLRWLTALRTMLAPAMETGTFEIWWDGEIGASQNWGEEIDTAMATAQVAVLLVSPYFLEAEFVRRYELPYLLEAAEKRNVAILWVLVTHCLYEHTPLVRIQAAHDLKRPLSSLQGAKRDAVLKTISQQIEQAARRKIGGITAAPAVPASTSRIPSPG